MRFYEYETKADGSPVSTQEENDARINAFKEAKKRRNRNTEIGSAMHVMDSDVITEDNELPIGSMFHWMKVPMTVTTLMNGCSSRWG